MSEEARTEEVGTIFDVDAAMSRCRAELVEMDAESKRLTIELRRLEDLPEIRTPDLVAMENVRRSIRRLEGDRESAMAEAAEAEARTVAREAEQRRIKRAAELRRAREIALHLADATLRFEDFAREAIAEMRALVGTGDVTEFAVSAWICVNPPPLHPRNRAMSAEAFLRFAADRVRGFQGSCFTNPDETGHLAYRPTDKVEGER